MLACRPVSQMFIRMLSLLTVQTQESEWKEAVVLTSAAGPRGNLMLLLHYRPQPPHGWTHKPGSKYKKWAFSIAMKDVVNDASVDSRTFIQVLYLSTLFRYLHSECFCYFELPFHNSWRKISCFLDLINISYSKSSKFVWLGKSGFSKCWLSGIMCRK